VHSMNSNGWKDLIHKTAQLYARILTPEELEIWRKILEPLPQKALLYAFDNWQRNGRFFCKPIDILDLVDVYKRGLTPSVMPRYEHHGEGYNEGDMLALWKLVSAESIALKRKLTQGEIWKLLGEVDKKRPSGAPAFRKGAA
jgi:hypothetical protein